MAEKLTKKKERKEEMEEEKGRDPHTLAPASELPLSLLPPSGLSPLGLHLKPWQKVKEKEKRNEKTENVRGVEMVGGSSRIPKIQPRDNVKNKHKHLISCV